MINIKTAKNNKLNGIYSSKISIIKNASFDTNFEKIDNRNKIQN